MKNKYTFLAFVLAICLPALSNLTILKLPLLSLEILVIFLVLVLFAFLFTLITSIQQKALTTLVFSSVIVLGIDEQLGLKSLIAGGIPLDGVSSSFQKVVWCAAFAFFWSLIFVMVRILRQNITKIIVVYFAVTFMMSFLLVQSSQYQARRAHLSKNGNDSKFHQSWQNQQSSTRRASTKAPKYPLIIHIVLDEMESPSSIPLDIEHSDWMINAIHNFQQRYDFALSNHVYSQYDLTQYSLPSMVNFELNRTEFRKILTSSQSVDGTWVSQLKKNRYFDLLAQNGYSIHVIQHGNLDFCKHPGVVSCHTEGNFNPLREGVYAKSQFTLRVSNAFFSAINRGSLFGRLVHAAYQVILGKKGVYSAFNPQVGLLLIEDIANEILNADRNSVVFAHLLLPHRPYILDANCIPSIEEESYLNFSELERRRNFKNYFQQVTCVWNKLDQFMSRPEIKSKLRDSLVIIHGDHGSRIVLNEGIQPLSDQQRKESLLHKYSTAFMTRVPQQIGDVQTLGKSLVEVFIEFISKNVSEVKVPSSSNKRVFLMKKSVRDGIVSDYEQEFEMPIY